MNFTTTSAILRGEWLLAQGFVNDHLPLITKMLKGESVNFGNTRHELPQAQAMAAGVYGVDASTSNLQGLPSGSIALVNIIGPVLKFGDMCSYGSVDHAAFINRLAAAPNVKGIILNVDSPGGQAAGTALLSDAIREAGKKKPVVGIIQDGIAASAGMWIISACTEIYTTQATDAVGSIGAYITIVDYYGYFEAQGIKIKDVYAPQSTHKNHEFNEALKNNEEPLKDRQKFLVNQFQTTVAANRGTRLKGDDWKTGKMYFSNEAIKIGLIDGIKSFDQVVTRVNQLVQNPSLSLAKSAPMAQSTTVAPVAKPAIISQAKPAPVVKAVEKEKPKTANDFAFQQELNKLL